MTLSVSDSRSNSAEQIAHAAAVIGRSPQRLQVFEAIYTGSRRIKTVEHIRSATGLNNTRVLQLAKELSDQHLVLKTEKDGRIAYQKDDFFHANKKKIISLVKDPKKAAEFPTKRNSTSRIVQVKSISIPRNTAHQITIDDIGSFVRVRSETAHAVAGNSLSEDSFKEGIQKIIGEPGEFRDWGGEQHDLYTTRLIIGQRRRSCAFAFKGPGTRGKLTPGKLGKNGDQIQRLFQTSCDVYIVQYCREIDHSVVEQMQALAFVRSLSYNKKVYYGIIDGVDSQRLIQAYENEFGLS